MVTETSKAPARRGRTALHVSLSIGAAWLAVPSVAASPPPAWIAPAIVAEQAHAADDAGREAVARRRARMLLAAMTTAQKMQQLTGSKPELLAELPQCYGARHVSGIAALAIPTFRISNGPVGVGQNDCVSASVADGANTGGIMAAAYTDPSSARATALPSAITMAASFDPAVASLFGATIANEMRALALHVFEAPGVNLARLPILGRNFEYFGEDPFLTGSMAVAEIRAVQDRGLIAMAKHFAANEQETNRMAGLNSAVDEQTMRELYLLPFEMAVKDARVAAVMCAYNAVNGTPACENETLLTGVLRREWGFTGYVQADFFAMKSTVATLKAGMDHEMPMPQFWNPAKLTPAIAKGEIVEADIDRALERRYTQMFKAGIFERRIVQTPVDFAAGGIAARRIGTQGAVLLQNNGALPLAGTVRTVALVGKASQPYAQQAVAGGALTGKPMGAGGGSSDVVPNATVSPVDGLRAALKAAGGEGQVTLILVDDANASATIDGRTVPFATALAAAAAADAVVVMAGTISEEGADRATFSDSGKTVAGSLAAGMGLDWYAPRSDRVATVKGPNPAADSRTSAMITALLATRSTTGTAMPRKTALVLKDNGGIAIDPALVGANGPAILEVWFPGQEDGHIVADLLFGRVDPSGRLPVTIPFAGRTFLDRAQPAQFPGVLDAGTRQQTVRYTEKLAIGYRWYDANAGGDCATTTDGRNPCVAFPFGHGLSYTSFAIGTPRLVRDKTGDRWTIRARVTNTGKRPGAQVVQAYVSLPPAAGTIGAAQPPKRLVGFDKVELAPGATKEVTIAIDPAASHHPLGVWSVAEKKWVVPAGRHTLWVGTSSAPRDLRQAGTIDR